MKNIILVQNHSSTIRTMFVLERFYCNIVHIIRFYNSFSTYFHYRWNLHGKHTGQSRLTTVRSQWLLEVEEYFSFSSCQLPPLLISCYVLYHLRITQVAHRYLWNIKSVEHIILGWVFIKFSLISSPLTVINLRKKIEAFKAVVAILKSIKQYGM